MISVSEVFSPEQLMNSNTEGAKKTQQVHGRFGKCSLVSSVPGWHTLILINQSTAPTASPWALPSFLMHHHWHTHLASNSRPRGRLLPEMGFPVVCDPDPRRTPLPPRLPNPPPTPFPMVCSVAHEAHGAAVVGHGRASLPTCLPSTLLVPRRKGACSSSMSPSVRRGLSRCSRSPA